MNRYMITNRYKSYIIPRIIKIIEKKDERDFMNRFNYHR